VTPVVDPVDREAGDLSADYLEHATRLSDAMVEALPGWIERSVLDRVASAGGPVDERARAAAADAGRRALDQVGPALRDLLGRDPDEQSTTPMTVARQAIGPAGDALRALGVPPVERDEFRRERFPYDPYDLTPSTFADIDPSLAEVGITWGAAKAYVHLQRRHGRTAAD
jgi:hypothetical protein